MSKKKKIFPEHSQELNDNFARLIDALVAWHWNRITTEFAGDAEAYFEFQQRKREGCLGAGQDLDPTANTLKSLKSK